MKQIFEIDKIFEVGNIIISIKSFITKDSRVKIVVKFFNFISICLFFKDKNIYSKEIRNIIIENYGILSKHCPIFEIGNIIISIKSFITKDSRVKIVVKFFNFISICLFFKDKNIYSKEIRNTYIIDYEILEKFRPIYVKYDKKDKFETDIKTIAWYLPQFHTFKENDEWWGKGFTEWTNVKKALPLYDGHYQPRTPHKDIGYYDLSDVNVMRKQVEIAKNYGLYGFCFYHYDFSGKRLMQKVVDNYIKYKDIDFNFCLSYANENWTKKWDGAENDILIKQDYSEKNDKKFIESLQVYLDDKRYIRIDDKPVLLVYKPFIFPNINKTTEIWRNYQIKKTVKDLFLIFTVSALFDKSKCEAKYFGFDEYVDFTIHNAMNGRKLRVNGKANVRSYREFVNEIVNLDNFANIKSYKDLFLMWDNSPRTKKHSILDNFSFDLYREWIKYNIKYTRENFNKDRRFMFINAWNEWGEGTYLEPDEKNGYMALNILYEELLKFSNK